MQRRLCKNLIQNLRIYGNLLLVSALSLETYNAVDKSEQCIVTAAAYIVAGMDLGSALSVENVAGQNELSVSSLGA